jgi:hypothetical protein
LGPYEIVEEDRPRENYRLNLPVTLNRVYPWFSIQKFKVYRVGPIANGNVLDRSDIVGAPAGTDRQGAAPVEEDRYQVDKIVAHREKRRAVLSSAMDGIRAGRRYLGAFSEFDAKIYC